MNTAILQVLAERISAAYASDAVKSVWTPFELVEQMLSKIKLDGSILVLSDLGFLPVLKSKGASFDRITFVAHTPEQELLANQMRVGKVLQVGYNEPIKELEQQLMEPKFDVIVGNPPYAQSNGAKNVKLWRHFSELALGLDPEFVAFVTPNNVISERGVNGAALRAKIKTGYGFIQAQDHNPPMFKGVGVATCHWVIQRGIHDSVDPIVVKNGLGVHEGQSILDKIDQSADERLQLQMQNGWVKRQNLTNNPPGSAIYFSGPKLQYTTDRVDTVGELKLVFPFSASYHKQFITRDALGMLNLYLPIRSEEQGSNIMSYTLSKLMVFFAKNYKKTSGFTPAVKALRLPKLDDTKRWTDAELYEYFGLTKSEIDLVESC